MRAIGLVVFISLALACGGKRTVGGKGPHSSKPATGEPSEQQAPADPAMVRKERLDFEFSALEDQEGYSLITLIAVDETGSSSRRKVGEYPGSCERIALDAAPGSGLEGELLAVRCAEDGGAGRDLRFVVRQGELVMLEARFDRVEDERSFEQRGSFPLPSGAKIEAEPLAAE